MLTWISLPIAEYLLTLPSVRYLYTAPVRTMTAVYLPDFTCAPVEKAPVRRQKTLFQAVILW